jgi:hypothetical protein
MNLTVMRPAQRHRELIAHLATKRTGLHKTQMMRIRRTPTANQAGLFDDMPDMIAVTNPAWFGEHQDALINLWRLSASVVRRSSRSMTPGPIPPRRTVN